MRLSTMLKMGAFGTFFRGRRHQGRHRCLPTSRPRRAWTLDRNHARSGEPQTATVDQVNEGTAPPDFYVVFPNVPARPTTSPPTAEARCDTVTAFGACVPFAHASPAQPLTAT